MYYQLTTVFGKIVIMIAIGFLAAKRGVLTGDMKKHLSVLLMKVLLPFNILSSANQLYDADRTAGMVQVLLICAVYYLVLLGILILAVRRMPGRMDALTVDLIVFANVGFIGFPVLGELFGDAGTLYTVAYNIAYQFFFFSFGLYLLDGQEKLSLRSLAGNQILYISALSIILYFMPWRFPEFIQSVVSSVGSTVMPLSMMIIGCEIAQMQWKEILADRKVYEISLLRLLILPLLMLGAVSMLPLDSVVAKSVVLLTALPCGSLTVIAAQEKGIDSMAASRAVAQTTLLMIVTLPVIFLLTERIPD